MPARSRSSTDRRASKASASAILPRSCRALIARTTTFWGRLHAVDRLIDIVCDSADVDPTQDGIDVPALKKRAFAQILDVEEPHLRHSAELIAAIRGRIAEMKPARRQTRA